MKIWIPSRGRAGAVPVEKKLQGLKYILVVPENELKKYRKAGHDAYDIIAEPSPFKSLNEKLYWIINHNSDKKRLLISWDNTNIVTKRVASVGDALESLAGNLSKDHPISGFAWNYFFPKNAPDIVINAREINHVFAIRPKTLIQDNVVDGLLKYSILPHFYLSIRCMIDYGIPVDHRAAVSYYELEQGGQKNQRKEKILLNTMEQLRDEFPEYVKIVPNTRGSRFQTLVLPVSLRVSWTKLAKLHV